MERNNDGIFRHGFMILLLQRFPDKGATRNRMLVENFSRCGFPCLAITISRDVER
jgi:hypothetical protein